LEPSTCFFSSTLALLLPSEKNLLNNGEEKKRKGQYKKGESSKKNHAVSKATMALKARHLESVCAEIESRRSAKGRIPRGEITRVFNANKPIYTWLTIDIIKKALKKCKGRTNSNIETISDLSDATNASAGAVALPNIPPPCTIGFIPPPANET
jgi:hypothetical protein